MRDLFDTIMETEEMITRKKRPAARKKQADRLSLIESISGRVKDEDGFFDLDHAVASRKSATEDLEWTSFSGEDSPEESDFE